MIEAMNRAARFFDADYADYIDDLPLLEAYAQRTGGPLLELGCGTGRLLIPLAEAGYRVTGVDLSPEMLRIAQRQGRGRRCGRARHADRGRLRRRAAGRRLPPGVRRDEHLPAPGHTGTPTAALRHWREHLAPGGLLLIDIFHPDVSQLAGLDGRLEWDKTWTDPETGATVMKWVTRTVDLAEQTLHVTLIYDEIAADGSLRRTLVPFDTRYLWRFEAELLLDKAGFALEALYGDWDTSPFESASDRMILVARRKR